MTPYLLVTAWIACGVAAYLLFRRAYRRSFIEWTIGVRAFHLFACLFGPISIVPAVIVSFCAGTLALPKWLSIDWNKPARW